MKLEQIVTGLLELLRENNYNEATIAVYEREWNHLKDFLVESYGDTEFSIEKGVCYLEHKYGFVTKYENGTISQQRVQFLRMIHLLEDYQLHGVLTKRYYASKNPIVLNEEYQNILAGYVEFLNTTELSKCTKEHYSSQCTVFLDYLQQIKLSGISTLSIAECNNYIKTMSGYSYKTIEQNICGLRHFLRYLYKSEITAEEIADKISMPNISKSAKIPSAWTVDELKLFLSVIDRSSPIGKRDYAAILLACILGIRSIDIKHLKFENFNWADHTLSFVQHKTHKPITLPLPNEVGWAVIDYIKNGRPSYYDTDIVFIKHMPPFDPIADNVHLSDRITYYMQKAHISTRKTDNVFKNKNGLKLSRDGISYIIQKYTNIVRLKDSNFPEKIHPHCFRHSKAMHMVSAGIPLIYIRDFLGHEDISTTMIYAKADPRMKEKAINELAPKIIEEAENTADWTKDKSLMSFLNNL